MGTITEKLNAALTSKTAIKTAIESKGLTVGDAPFADYADKILAIETGGSSGDGSFEFDNLYDYAKNILNNDTSLPSLGLKWILLYAVYDYNEDAAINFNVYSVDSTDRFVFSDDLGTIKGKESHKWDKTKDLYGFGYRFRYVLGTKTVVYDANTPKTIYSPISLGATQLGFIIKCDGIPDGVCPNYNFNTNIAQDNYALEFGDLGGIKLKENFYFAFRSCQALKSLYNLNFANVNTTSAGVSNLANITYPEGYKISYNTSLTATYMLTKESIINTFNALEETTTTKTLSLGATNRARLTDAEIAIATSKGWTVS